MFLINLSTEDVCPGNTIPRKEILFLLERKEVGVGVGVDGNRKPDYLNSFSLCIKGERSFNFVPANQLLTFCLMFTGTPTIDEQLSTSTVYTKLGHSVAMSCYARNYYPIIYTWSKSGKVLETTATIQPNSKVAVVQIRTELDLGEYVCNASSLAGHVVRKITVADLAKLSG